MRLCVRAKVLDLRTAELRDKVAKLQQAVSEAELQAVGHAQQASELAALKGAWHTAKTELGNAELDQVETRAKLAELERKILCAREASNKAASQQHDAQLRLQTAAAALDDVTIRSTALQHTVDSLTLQLETEHAASTASLALQHARSAKLEQKLASAAAELVHLRRSFSDMKTSEALLGSQSMSVAALGNQLEGMKARAAAAEEESRLGQVQVAKL